MVKSTDELGINYLDIMALWEYKDFRIRRENGISLYSWPYFTVPGDSLGDSSLGSPSKDHATHPDINPAEDVVEIRFLTSRLVYVDLNPYPRNLDRFHDNLDSTRYFNQADLVFDPVTGLVRKHFETDLDENDPRWQKFSVLNESNSMDSYLDQKVPIFENYKHKFNGYYLYDIMKEPKEFEVFLARLLVADDSFKREMLTFLLEAEDVFLGSSAMVSGIKFEYLSTLIACGLSTVMSDQCIELQDQFYDEVDNLEFNSKTATTINYRTTVLKQLHEADLLNPDFLKSGFLNRTIAVNEALNSSEDLQLMTYVIAHILMGEEPTQIPVDALVEEYQYLKWAVARADDYEIRRVMAMINDKYFKDTNYALLVTRVESEKPVTLAGVEVSGFTTQVSTYVVYPVQVRDHYQASEEYDIRFEVNGKTYAYPNYVYKVRNVQNDEFQLLKNYYVSKGLESRNLALATSYANDLNTIVRYYDEEEKGSINFGIVILIEDYQKAKYIRQKSVFLENKNSNAENPFCADWLLGAHDYDNEEKLEQAVFYHEYGHLDFGYYGGEKRYHEIYATLYALTKSEDLKFSLYKCLDRFLAMDVENKVHLIKVYDEKSEGFLGYNVQQNHAAGDSYFFLRFARDDAFWNGNPPLSSDETFVTVYENSPEEFHDLMVKIHDEINAGIASIGEDDFRKATAVKYLQELQ